MILIKYLLKYYKRYKKLLLLDIACTLMVVSIDLTFPMITRYSLQQVLPIQAYTIFIKIIALMLMLYFLRGICEYCINYFGNVLGIRIERDLRNDLFSHIQYLSIDYFDRNRTGEIMARIINDLADIAELSHKGIELFIFSSITFTGSFILLLKIQWRLALIVYAFIPFLILFAIKQRLVMKRGFSQVKKQTGLVAARLENAISGIRVAKAYGNEQYEIKKFEKDNQRYSNYKGEAYKRMAIFISGVNVTIHLLNVIIISVGGYFVAVGLMDVPDLLTFMLFVSRFLLTVKRITTLTKQYESGMAGIQRFSELMNEQPTVKESDTPIHLSKIHKEIRFNNVSFSYERNTILKELSVRFNTGKKYAIVGMSGSGKSTVCRLIQRQYDPQIGEIQVDGIPLNKIHIKSLRDQIGVVEQDVFLFADTIRENIRYGRLDASEDDIINAAKKADIHDFIMEQDLGYDTYVGERGIKLSGGQKQRISIARMFLKNPEILILDEATSALDQHTEKNIQQAMDKLAKGRTVIIIAHRLTSIKEVDEIIVLQNGRLAEKGTHEELLHLKSAYFKLFKK